MSKENVENQYNIYGKRVLMPTKLDGRDMRWFDCNWNVGNKQFSVCCEKCRVCKHYEWEEYIEQVAPRGSEVEWDKEVLEYIKIPFENVKAKQEFILKLKQ